MWRKNRVKRRAKAGKADAQAAPKKVKENDPGAYHHVPKENAVLEKYYKGIQIVPDEEWDEMFSTLKRQLPVTFRITANYWSAAPLSLKLQNDFVPGLKDKEIDGEPVPSLQPLPWYPDNLGWHFPASRSMLRKCPTLKRLHNFLLTQSEHGFISRQEAVSMIPPFLLDVQPHHYVLDMCAAPGSKTAQLIEMLHQDDPKRTSPPGGLVVANEIDEKRAHLLVHQTKRLNSPNIMVTCHEAQGFPFVRILDDNGSPSYVEFDRILADVPCSGDGTLRKNMDLWGRWNPCLGIGLHRTQLKIGIRGAHLLKIGGRMVYSTCSFNPVENEAVVCELLRLSKGALELVDVSDKLPLLKRRSGMRTWKILDKTQEWYETERDVPNGRKSKVFRSMFPPTEKEANRFHIERCVRIVPHDQDTGGFFIALLQKTRKMPRPEDEDKETPQVTEKKEKTGECPSEVTQEKEACEEKEKEEKEEEKDAEMETEGKAKEEGAVDGQEESSSGTGEAKGAAVMAGKKHSFGGREAPFYEIGPAWRTQLDILKGFYGITSDVIFANVFVRSQGKMPDMYYLSNAAKRVLLGRNHGLKVVNTGMRLLSKHPYPDVQCEFRLCSEGVDLFLPHASAERVVHMVASDLPILLKEKDPMCSKFSAAACEKLMTLSKGGFLIVIDMSSHPGMSTISMSAWRGKVSVHPFVTKQENAALCSLFLNEVSAEETEAAAEASTAAGEHTHTSHLKLEEETEALPPGSSPPTGAAVTPEKVRRLSATMKAEIHAEISKKL